MMDLTGGNRSDSDISVDEKPSNAVARRKRNNHGAFVAATPPAAETTTTKPTKPTAKVVRKLDAPKVNLFATTKPNAVPTVTNYDSSRKRASHTQRNERGVFVAATPPEQSTKPEPAIVVRKLIDAPKINLFATKPKALPLTNDADDEFDIDEAEQNETFSSDSWSMEDEGHDKDKTRKSKRRRNTMRKKIVSNLKKFQQESVQFAAHISNGGTIHREQQNHQQHATTSVIKPCLFNLPGVRLESSISCAKIRTSAAAGTATAGLLTIDTSNLTRTELARVYRMRDLQRGVITDYFQTYRAANVDKSDTECRAHAVNELTKQGFCPELSLEVVQHLLDNNMQPKKKAVNDKREQFENDVREKFHEYVQMVCDGDLKQFSILKFADSIESTFRVVDLILKKTEFGQRMRQMRKDDEALFEARRSIIISKFVEFSGDLRERRNACIRYFWNTPHYDARNVLSACNRFVKFGTVRTNEKNKATEWVGNDKDRLRAEVSPAEAEFVQALNTERAQLACDLNVRHAQKRAQRLATLTSKAPDTDDDADDEGGQIPVDGKDTMAALKASNETLRRELQESKNLLVLSELKVENLQQQLSEAANSSTRAE